MEKFLAVTLCLVVSCQMTIAQTTGQVVLEYQPKLMAARGRLQQAQVALKAEQKVANASIQVDSNEAQNDIDTKLKTLQDKITLAKSDPSYDPACVETQSNQASLITPNDLLLCTDASDAAFKAQTREVAFAQASLGRNSGLCYKLYHMPMQGALLAECFDTQITNADAVSSKYQGTNLTEAVGAIEDEAKSCISDTHGDLDLKIQAVTADLENCKTTA